MADFSEKELFESVPVPQAVATLAIPTVISQVVTMIYNLADTFFVGQIGDPYMVAAVSLVSPGSTCSPPWAICSDWGAAV